MMGTMNTIGTVDEEEDEDEVCGSPTQITKETRRKTNVNYNLTESYANIISFDELKLRGAIFSNFINRDSIGDLFATRISGNLDKSGRASRHLKVKNSILKNSLLRNEPENLMSALTKKNHLESSSRKNKIERQ